MFKSVHHINLIVSDMEKTKEFYNKLLGLDSVMETVIEDPEFSRGVGLQNTKLLATFFALLNNSALIETFQYLSPPDGKTIPADKRANDAGWTHLCFLVEDIEQTVKELVGRGIEFLTTPVTIGDTHIHVPGVRFCYFRGPDGEVLEILQG